MTFHSKLMMQKYFAISSLQVTKKEWPKILSFRDGIEEGTSDRLILEKL